MFNINHYVPVLRWKRAEEKALLELDNEVKSKLTPLIELIPRDFQCLLKDDKTNTDEIVDRKMKGIHTSWEERPFFLDIINLVPFFESKNRFDIIDSIFKSSFKYNLKLIPVINLDSSKELFAKIKSFIKGTKNGLSIRLKLKDLKNPSLEYLLNQLIKYFGLNHSLIDLIIDFEFTNNIKQSLGSFFVDIPNLNEWRTLTITCGAFPKDLTGFSPGQHKHPRLDWGNWINQIYQSEFFGLRKPTFGDYTIQHGKFYELPPGRLNYSASIRYTSNNYWVIMRGEGVFNDEGPGFSQWPANAQMLVRRSEFCGSNFSYGDQYIDETSKQRIKTGSAETWLRAGINHHLTFVVNQITNLSVS